MEISSSYNTSQVRQPPPKPPQMNSTSLTDDQKSSLQEILAKYDSANMSDEDKQTLLDELKSSNIPPSEETFAALEEAGLELPPPPDGGPGGESGGPPSLNSQTLSEEMKDQLISALESGDASSIEDILDMVSSSTGKNTGLLFDKSV